MKSVFDIAILIWLAATFSNPAIAAEPVENDYYKLVSIITPDAQSESRSTTWKPAPEGLALEVSGMTAMKDGRLAVAIRKGEIWLLNGVYDLPPKNVTYKRFASGLHEPLGLLWREGSFYTVQRSELTELRDLTDDGIADRYRTIAKGWGVTGHYHEYAYGPKVDGDGNMWLTLNVGMGMKDEHKKRTVLEPTLGYRQGLWRGWGMRVDKQGELEPMTAGMRSPCGLGANAAGDMFYTDQQGNWVATNSLFHMRRGVFSHHAESLASMGHKDSPIKGVKSVPSGLLYPVALKRFPQMRPPAVWFPYKKMGQSATDILLDESAGKFGPFAGQLFIGEFTHAGMHRVFLEKVNGEYQGACFPFRRGFASAVLRMSQGKDGSMFVGLSNRGWSSLGTASYGLQRLVWTGKTPFEIKEMRARPDGFELVFTKPVDQKIAADSKSYTMKSYTYRYHSAYGSDEMQTKNLKVYVADVSADGLKVTLRVEGLREHYMHELVAEGLRSETGEPLLHSSAYYTLNEIPGDE